MRQQKMNVSVFWALIKIAGTYYCLASLIIAMETIPAEIKIKFAESIAEHVSPEESGKALRALQLTDRSWRDLIHTKTMSLLKHRADYFGTSRLLPALFLGTPQALHFFYKRTNKIFKSQKKLVAHQQKMAAVLRIAVEVYSQSHQCKKIIYRLIRAGARLSHLRQDTLTIREPNGWADIYYHQTINPLKDFLAVNLITQDYFEGELLEKPFHDFEFKFDENTSTLITADRLKDLHVFKQTNGRFVFFSDNVDDMLFFIARTGLKPAQYLDEYFKPKETHHCYGA